MTWPLPSASKTTSMPETAQSLARSSASSCAISTRCSSPKLCRSTNHASCVQSSDSPIHDAAASARQPTPRSRPTARTRWPCRQANAVCVRRSMVDRALLTHCAAVSNTRPPAPRPPAPRPPAGELGLDWVTMHTTYGLPSSERSEDPYPGRRRSQRPRLPEPWPTTIVGCVGHYLRRQHFHQPGGRRPRLLGGHAGGRVRGARELACRPARLLLPPF
eukprot:COSAG04_NODE_1676_length_5966_cov_34.273734_5_plen_218_part_00